VAAQLLQLLWSKTITLSSQQRKEVTLKRGICVAEAVEHSVLVVFYTITPSSQL
jgi:hypothetical protein